MKVTITHDKLPATIIMHTQFVLARVTAGCKATLSGLLVSGRFRMGELKRIVGITLFCWALLVLCSLPLEAGEPLTAQHKLISETLSSTGLDISLDLTITNSGAESLNSVTLEPIDTIFFSESGSNVLTLDYLPAGGTVTSPLTISSMAHEYISVSMITFQVKGTDESGAPVEFMILSQEGGK